MMWKVVAENSALLLGFAISFYTVYSFVETRMAHQRQRYALLRSLRLEAEYFITLARSLSQRAEQVVDLYAKQDKGEAFPSPAAEADSLPDASQAAILWLVARAEHLLSYEFPGEVEELWSMLNKKQIEALLKFMAAYRIYTQVLATRTFDLKMFPRKPGVLRRFAGVVLLNLDDLDKQLDAFGRSLGIREKTA